MSTPTERIRKWKGLPYGIYTVVIVSHTASGMGGLDAAEEGLRALITKVHSEYDETEPRFDIEILQSVTRLEMLDIKRRLRG